MPSMRQAPKWNRPGRVSISGLSSAAESFACCTMASASGIIIAVVAVFDTHIETNPAAHMKPRTIRVGEVPIRFTIASAMRRWRFHRCMACASMKPPREEIDEAVRVGRGGLGGRAEPEHGKERQREAATSPRAESPP